MKDQQLAMFLSLVACRFRSLTLQGSQTLKREAGDENNHQTAHKIVCWYKTWRWCGDDLADPSFVLRHNSALQPFQRKRALHIRAQTVRQYVTIAPGPARHSRSIHAMVFASKLRCYGD
jgi:hypothetical protein